MTKAIIAALLLTCPAFTQPSYTISTVAGGASPYFSPGLGDGGLATSAALGNPTYDVAVDATSTFEVGGAGRAAAGFLTVDAGAAIDGGLDTDAPIINNGTIINPAELDGAVSNDGTISGGGTIDGAISGTGTIQVGIGTPLLLNGGVGNGQTLDFLGVDAALSMPVTSRPALIRDFGTLDVLTITGAAIDAASWVYGTPSLGTLDLWQDGTVVDTLPIAGQYPGISFLTNPDRTAGTDIVMVVGTAPVYGQLSWAASLPGNWGDAGNWTVDSGGDTAPGAFDNAIIGQPEHYVATVAGTQSVHNLTLDGAGALLDVIGTFNVGGTLLDQAGTFVVAGGGELVGGTYILGAGAIPITGNGGTLDGTTWQGTLDIATTSTLDFINGLTLQGSGGVGPGAMVMAFSSSTAIVLHILDGETWDNASLTLSSATIDGIAGASLTLGPDFSAAIFWINFVDDQTVSFNLPVTNNGTLFTNDQLLNFASTLDNTGTIGVNEYAGHLSVLDLSNTGQISVGQYDDETLNVAGNVQGA